MIVCVDICRFGCFAKAEMDLSVDAKIVGNGGTYEDYDEREV